MLGLETLSVKAENHAWPIGRTICAVVCLAMSATGWAQDIIGTGGTPMGDLEPWGTPVERRVNDAGMARRLEDIMRPPIGRLDAAEAKFRVLSEGGDKSVLVDELSRHQAEVCMDVISLIGTLKKHRNEIQSWHLGSQAESVGGSDEGFGARILLNALGGAGDSNSVSRSSARWKWCTLAWLPFGCGLRLNPGEDRMVRELGFAVSLHVSQSDWALAAFLTMLRHTAASPDGRSQPAGVLQGLLAGEISRQVVACGLGQTASSEEFDQQVEPLIGRRAVLSIFRPELQEKWVLEGGEFDYLSLRSEAESPVRESLEQALLSGGLKGGFVLKGASPEELSQAYEHRKIFFAILNVERTKASAVESGDRAAVERMYDPFLSLLARFPPCLSLYRPGRVNENWLCFVEDETPEAASVAVTSSRENTQLEQGGASVLCLLQSDCWKDEGGSWRWRPRVAGSRKHLDHFLSGLFAASTKAPAKEVTP